MKFFCYFENHVTGERRDLISTLDPDEIAEVERARASGGDEQAALIAHCHVLKSAYAELDALHWSHLSRPNLSR